VGANGDTVGSGETPARVTEQPAGNGGRFQVGIVVGGDVSRMVEFYADILGFRHFRDIPIAGGTVKQYVLGESSLKLMTFERPVELANPPGGPNAVGLRYLTIEVPSVVRTVDRCLALGCEVPMPTFEYEGSPLAIVNDPQGTWIELIEPTARP
jgi:catechol 2,3-dioxygenase-like lactoylglutathione lyase family enzyme